MPRHDAFDHSYMGPCAEHQRREALLQLAGVFDPAWQSALQASLTRAQAEPSFDWQGLWVARHAGRIDAAVWVEPLTDATAQLWLPAVHSDTVDALLASVRQWVDRQGFDLCHVTLNTDQHAWKAPLTASGMQAIATLEHLKTPLEAPEPSPEMLHMAPLGELAYADRLALLRGISEDSLDCPVLLDALSMETLLAGFHAQAPGALDHWYRALCGDETAGILLLAPQTVTHWELQLMGLLPVWRGKGLGRALVQQAKRLACQGGASTLALTVDAYNTPACRLYAQAGFSREREQQLYGWRRRENRK
ncbi:GNAT family N-acetyltransferase [Vreelandella sp. EE22]